MNDEGISLPVDRASADFSADRHRLDATRSFWATSNTDRGVQLTRWDLISDRWAIVVESPASSWLVAVHNDAELIAVRADEVTDYQALDSSCLLEALVPVGNVDATEVDWPFDVQDYESEDEDFSNSEGVLRRYSRIQGRRLYFAESDGDPLPFSVEGDRVDGDQVATFSWGSEAGMTSGAGGWTWSK